MEKERSLARVALVLLTLLAAACREDPPTRLVNFPNLTCGESRLNAAAEARLIADPEGGEQPALVVKVCLDCSGEPISEAGGIRGQIGAPPEGTPPMLRGPFALARTDGNGCTSMVFRFVPEGFAQRPLRVQVPDDSGRVVKDVTIDIADDR